MARRDGDMRERWRLAGLLDAESRFHRVRGYKQMPTLLSSLKEIVQPALDPARKRA